MRHERVMNGHSDGRSRQRQQQHLEYVQLRHVILQGNEMQQSSLTSRQPNSGAADGFVRRQGLPAPWMRRIHRRNRAGMTRLRVVATT